MVRSVLQLAGRAAALATLTFALVWSAASPAAQAQELVQNWDFEDSSGWEVYDMGSNDPSEFQFEFTDECPSEGDGKCLLLFGTSTYTNILVWQPLQLIAGVPYEVNGAFRALSELENYWGQLYLSEEEPIEGVDWTPSGGTNDAVHFGFNTWAGCGPGVDGTFQEDACEGPMTPTYTPPGTAGEEVTIYLGFKTGICCVDSPAFYAVTIDNLSVKPPEGVFASADFSREPTGRVMIGEEITFDASASTGSADLSYAWDFGDGNTASGEVVTHAFTEEGNFDVTLTVTSSDGGAHSTTRSVTVWSGVGSEANPLQIPRAPSAPVIDAEIDDVWLTNAVTIQIATHMNDDAPESEEDLSAEAHIMWDDDNIYVLFEVQDEVLKNDSGNAWEDDTPEFYLDAGNEKVFQGYDENDGAWEFSWGAEDNPVTGNANDRGMAEDVEYAWATVEGGYVVESMVPWFNVDLQPVEGHLIGFEAAVNDDDDENAGRDTKIGWFTEPQVDEAWQWAHVFGTAELVGELIVSAEAADELPEGFSIESVYPNPFNPSATAVLSVREAGAYAVGVYDALGRLVMTQQINAQVPGRQEIRLDLGNNASGVYLLRATHEASGRSASTRIVLAK